MNDVDRCLICGEIIPEGSQVCTACRNKYDIVTGETEEMAQELRDVADVLKSQRAQTQTLESQWKAY